MTVSIPVSCLRRRRKSGGRIRYLHHQVGEVTLIFTTSEKQILPGEPVDEGKFD